MQEYRTQAYLLLEEDCILCFVSLGRDMRCFYIDSPPQYVISLGGCSATGAVCVSAIVSLLVIG